MSQTPSSKVILRLAGSLALKALGVLLLIVIAGALFLAASAFSADGAEPMRQTLAPLPTSNTVTVAPKVEIQFHAENKVSNVSYTLGDIADVVCSDPLEQARLEGLALGKCPQVGVTSPLSARQLAATLEIKGMSKDATLTFPKNMLLERCGKELDQKELREMMEAELRAKLPEALQGCVLSGVQTPRSLLLPVGALEWNVEMRLPPKNIGMGTFNAEPVVNGIPQMKFSGGFKIDQNVTTLQATTVLRKGEVLRAENCKDTSITLSSLRGKPITAADLGEALTAKRPLTPGENLTWENVERQVMVRNGQLVEMKLESVQGMSIITRGQAKMSGALGDTIDVVNVSSGTKIHAVVSGPEKVIVPF
ncbi:TPA: flagella basal body P-ring formation protein FlgA [Candidatus Sumerlaeota bacterium]|jgi:flagella basal body P-ring formation protein FlgA|nr:flagella basal body P-ring formation protein FlgA [Candidatus Sumerlaeota bacterium]